MSHVLNSSQHSTGLRNKSGGHFGNNNQNNAGNQNTTAGVQGFNSNNSQGGGGLFKVLKKSQIDTSGGSGFMFSNTMTATQLRTHSRNNNQQPLSTTGPLSHFLDSGSLMNALAEGNGSPNISNKKAASSASRNTYAGNALKKQQYYTQNPQATNIANNRLTDLTGASPATKNQVQRQNSNRRVQQQSNQSNNQTSASLQVQNLTQFLKDQSKNNQNILPPMTVTNSQSNSKNAYSRNMAYKQSLSDSINSKMVKGLSPKSTGGNDYFNSNQSPGKNNNRAHSQINQENSSGAVEHGTTTNFALKANKGSNLSLTRTRNTAQSLGRNTGDLTGFSKPQFYTMKNATTSSLQHQQSPHNYSGRFNQNSQMYPKNLLANTSAQAPTQSINGFGLEYDPTLQFIQSYDPAKYASKRNGVVVSYAANTHQGIIRNYNEDRVSIILNIIQPKFKDTKYWPRCSFFGVYDGHGGAACADYLRDQLHQLIVKDPNFPANPKKAIENAFEEAEKCFLEFADNQAVVETGQIDRSGSCAIIVLIVGDMCYVANVGDSRAIMSVDGGEKILLLSKDHKPESDEETKRIEENGGRIYQNSNYIPDVSPSGKGQMQLIVGPHRVFPGRLSVSRTFGDIEAKDFKYGGNPKVVIPTPDIKSFKIRNNYDFIIIACDGVFEKLSNQDVVNAVWQASKYNPKHPTAQLNSGVNNQAQSNNPSSDNRSIHEKCGHSIDRILHTSAFKRTFDNITAVMIAFENFENIAGQPINNPGGDQQEINTAINVQELSQFDKFNSLGNVLDTVIEEEYIQNEELDPLSLLSPPNLPQDNPTATSSDIIYKPIYNQNNATVDPQPNNSQEDYQVDINNTSATVQRKKSAENLLLAQSKEQHQQRRQSASSPVNQRPKVGSSTQLGGVGNSQSALNYQSNVAPSNQVIPTRQSFQQVPQSQQQQTRLSDNSFSSTKQDPNKHPILRNNKSSSLGRRESRGSAAIQSTSNQNHPQRILSTDQKHVIGSSSSSRNNNADAKALTVQQQQMSLTQSLITGLGPFTSNYQIDKFITNPTKNPTRNSQLKQYSSLGGQAGNQNIPLVLSSTDNFLDFNKTQQFTTSSAVANQQQSKVNNAQGTGKNWFSNTQQLSGISQLHKHYEKQTKPKKNL